jgi:predicted transcriptional regulator
MRVSELAEKIGLSSLCDCEKDREIEGVYVSDMVSDIITGATAGGLLITLQTHKSLIAAANLVDVAAVVFVRGRRPADDVIQLARKAGIGLFVTDADTWTFAKKLIEIGVQ